MGNTPSRMTCQSLFSAVESILNRLRSVFLTDRTAKDLSPGATSNVGHDTNMTTHPESQEVILHPNNSSTADSSLVSVPRSSSVHRSFFVPESRHSSDHSDAIHEPESEAASQLGNTCQPPFSAVKLVLNRIRSVFSTARTAKDSALDAISDSDHDANMTSHSEFREVILHPNNNSATVDCSSVTLEPVYSWSIFAESSSSDLIGVPVFHARDSSVRCSSASSQTHSVDEQPSVSRWYDPDVISVAESESHIAFSEVTITAFTETGQAESSIKVPLQRSYTGTKPVIPSSLADTSCATLGIPGLLDLFNATLGTSHTLDTPSLSYVLEDCIKNNYDFGTAYGRLRAVWSADNHRDNVILDELRRREANDRKRRQESLVGNRIVRPSYLEPRRVWDLCANRVVPWWNSGAFLDWIEVQSSMSIMNTISNVRPISHAWMDAKDRVEVQTPINGYEWPVPVPKDANLNFIRIEMLNLGVEYTWPDVLCLRQKGGTRDSEELREEEWKLDVPTIGNVYRVNKVMIYLSGLGRLLTLKEGDLESDQCWFRRAWTLQEVGQRRIIAGDVPDGPLHAEPIDEDDTGILTRFHKQLQAIDSIHHLSQRLSLSPGMFEVLSKMQKRVSTNPVDKIVGVAIPLLPRMIPAYHESDSLEGAWTAMVNAMFLGNRGELFFWYPEPGDAGQKWRPSWDQVMKEPLPANKISNMKVGRDDETDDDWYEGPCVEKGFVRGFATGSMEKVIRRGELIVKHADGIEHIFKIIAHHGYPIPEDTYTLLGMYPATALRRYRRIWTQYWVIGRKLSGEKFEKVSVFEMANRKEVQRLSVLGITEKCWNILI